MIDTDQQQDELRREVLARRLKAVTGGVLFTVLASFASAVSLLAVYSSIALHPLVLAWIGCLLALQALRIKIANNTNTAITEEAYVRSRLRLVTADMIGVSLIWSCAFPLFATLGDEKAMAALSGVGAAMFVGVLLMHRMIPLAAYVHITSFSIGLPAGQIIAPGHRGRAAERRPSVGFELRHVAKKVLVTVLLSLRAVVDFLR